MADPGNWFDRAMTAAGDVWRGVLPPNVRRSYESLGTLAGELSPGAAIRDTLDASGRMVKNAFSGDGWDAAGAGANMLTAMAGVIPAGRLLGKTGNALTAPIRGYHGSPHNFDRFDAGKIGTGEGNQAYGHGLYFAQDPSVARTYRAKVSAMQGGEPPSVGGRPINWDDPIETAAFELARHGGDRNAAAEFFGKTFKAGSPVPDILRSNATLPDVKLPGHMYEVGIHADPARFLDWDRMLAEQHPDVRRALNSLPSNEHVGASLRRGINNEMFGGDLIGANKATPAQISNALAERGIPGVRYLDDGSRGAGEGSRNYVIFPGNEHLIEIVRKYGLIPVTAAGAVIAGSTLPTAGEIQ